MNKHINIVLPADQLEGTQATFTTWLIEEGDLVKQGQPIAELETDKVAMEVCAEQSGVIESLIAKQGDQVEPENCLGTILLGVSTGVSATQKSNAGNMGEISGSVSAAEQSMSQVKKSTQKASTVNASELVSPAVRRLLHENNLNLEKIDGSGKRGRVTRDDVLKFIKNDADFPVVKAESSQSTIQSTTVIKPVSPFDSSMPKLRPLASAMHPHSNMRKSIASHMVSSLLETSPHVTSVFEMDMGNIIEHRKWHKKEYLECGVKLTFTAYFLAAMAKAVASVPQVNAKFHQDALEIFSDVNIGVGTALGDSGLVVPVVQQVQSMNLFQITKALNLQTEKARNGKLTTSDMKNGTLTISNHGVSGSLFATPIIINQPQVAILGIGKLEKRVVVEQVNGEDKMVIRPKCYVSLSIDHRALDAHQTNLYLSEFVGIIESWGE